MSYVLKKPTRMATANGRDDAGVDPQSSGLPTCARVDDDAPAAAAPTLDAARRVRADAVKDAFVAMFGRLEGLLGERWTGAHDRLQSLFPQTSAALDVAERRVDELAVMYIDGRTAEAAFASGLDEYETVYTQAAQLLTAQDRIEKGRCLACGRTELTVVVRDEQGHPYCRACLGPGVTDLA